MGSTYELAIFGANRRPVESAFSLSLGGFDGGATVSTCAPRCGDGVRAGDEECDLGAANDDTAYGGCTTTCAFGPRCGDGKIDRDQGEACDLGKDNRDGYAGVGPGCTRSCQSAPACGDGIVDPVFEQCDLGALNGKAIRRDPTDTCPRPLCTSACLVPRD